MGRVLALDCPSMVANQWSCGAVLGADEGIGSEKREQPECVVLRNAHNRRHRNVSDQRVLMAACRCVLQHNYLNEYEVVDVLLVSRAFRDVVEAIRMARRSVLFTSSVCSRHRIPRRSERPERIQLIMERCRQRFPLIKCINDLSGATDAQLSRFHTDIHLSTMTRLGRKIERSMLALEAWDDSAAAACCPRRLASREHHKQYEFIDIDDDTIMMRHTLEASRTAAGAVCHAIDYVMHGKAQNAFCVVRPPGHHAEPQRAMGFCFFNNVGVGAFHALDRYQLDRVLILDFDVHHGNGTQKRVESEPRLMYVSLHQCPLFPGTGFEHEEGMHGNIVNIPLKPRTSSRIYRKLFLKHVVDRIHKFSPQLILLSAGFDAHANDPLAQLQLKSEDYYWLTSQIMQLAWVHCQGRVVSVLEGGYHPRALADSAEQHILALVHGSTKWR